MFGSRSPRLSPAPLSFSVNSVPSVLRFPLNRSSQLFRHARQPNRFPLFPHPVNIAHTPAPANPFRSIVYFTVLCSQGFSRAWPSPIAPFPSHTPINPLDATLTSLPVSIDSKQLTQSLNPLNATFTENRGEGSIWLTRPGIPVSSVVVYQNHFSM